MRANSKLESEFDIAFAGRMQLPNLCDLFNGQKLSVPMGFPRCTHGDGGIMAVLFRSPQGKMIRTNACLQSPGRTNMSNYHPLRDWSVVEYPTGLMRSDALTGLIPSLSEIPVSFRINRSGPKPMIFRLVHFGEKTISKSCGETWGKRGVLGGVAVLHRRCVHGQESLPARAFGVKNRSFSARAFTGSQMIGRNTPFIIAGGGKPAGGQGAEVKQPRERTGGYVSCILSSAPNHRPAICAASRPFPTGVRLLHFGPESATDGDRAMFCRQDGVGVGDDIVGGAVDVSVGDGIVDLHNQVCFGLPVPGGFVPRGGNLHKVPCGGVEVNENN